MIRIQVSRRRTRRRGGLRAWRGRIVIAVGLISWGVYIDPVTAKQIGVDVGWMVGYRLSQVLPWVFAALTAAALYYAADSAVRLKGRRPLPRPTDIRHWRPPTRGAYQQTFLYRWYGPHGGDPDRLLYVGISNQPVRRTGQHEDHQPWWASVRRSTVVPYPSRPAALEAERAAIITERPVFNVQHNGRRRSAWGLRAA